MCSLLVVAALGAGVVSSCASRPPLVDREPSFDPLTLYPLREGNAWSYDVDTGDAQTTLAITRVVSVDAQTVRVRTGDSLVEYEVRPEGIYVAEDGAWLLRGPVRRGVTWPARGGRTAEIVAMPEAVETPAGTLRGCVEVLERGGRLDLEIRTIYCEGVGPASVSSTMRSATSNRTLTVTAVLRGYDVAAAGVPTRRAKP